MLTFHKIDKFRIGIQFSGYNFSHIQSLLHTRNIYHQKKYKGLEHIWIMHKKNLLPILSDLCEIENIPVPEDILEFCKEENYETTFNREIYRKSLLKCDPLGQYQESAIIRGINQNRLFLAHEQSLGKTISVISIINHLWFYKRIDRVLIVCMPEALYNFKNEFLKFNTFNLTKEDFYIANVKNRDPFNSDKKIIIMTYRTFLMLSDEAYKKKKKKSSKDYTTPVLDIDKWGIKRCIVLDESQRIARQKARQTRVIHLHKYLFKYRYLLSATPEPNEKVEGWYSQLTFLDEGSIPYDYYGWLRTIAKLGDRYSNYTVKEYYPDKIKNFFNRITLWVDRVLAEGNLKLPELILKKNYIELSNKHKQIYMQASIDALKTLKENKKDLTTREFFKGIQFSHITLALDNPCLLKGKIDQFKFPGLFKLVETWKFKDHSKIEACSSLLEQYIEEQEKKVIFWSWHPDTLEDLALLYKKYNPVVIHGSQKIPRGITKDEYRNDLLNKFKTHPECPLLVASSLVLATSINIIEASRMVYFDRSWNFEPFDHSKKRIHRPGQKDKCIGNLLIAQNTLECKLDRILDGREDRNESVFKSEYLTKEQWRGLFLDE